MTRFLRMLAVGACFLHAFALATGVDAMAYELRVSSSQTRSPSLSLEGEVVAGSIYVFVDPDAGVDDVVFYFDDVDLAGTPHRTEGNPPFDFMGGPPDSPRSFDTATVVDGVHTISANIVLKDGGAEVVHATFSIANDPSGGADADGDGFALPFDCDDGDPFVHPGASEICNGLDEDCDGLVDDGNPGGGGPCATGQLGVCANGSEHCVGGELVCSAISEASQELCATGADEDCDGEIDESADCIDAAAHSLWVSARSDRVAAARLEGARVADDVYVFVEPPEEILAVAFFVDDPDATGAPEQTERKAPYDLAGTASSGEARPFDTTGLADGLHTVTAVIDRSDGATSVVEASFTVENDAPALRFDPGTLQLSLREGETGMVTAVVSAPDPGVSFTVEPSASGWLTVIQGSGLTPGSIDLEIDASGLAPGGYATTATATATGHLEARLTINVAVSAADGAFDLFVSPSPDRSGSTALEGAVVAGDLYVFLAPEAGVSRVSFHVDDPERLQDPTQVESKAPFDLRGTESSTGNARPFDSTTVADGPHTVTALVEPSGGGTEIVHAVFEITNTAPLPDEDGDGASPPLDCDDSDPTVRPGIAEVCDGRDNDCDTIVDEDRVCCGNGAIDPGEACDGSAVGSCSGGCGDDCSCLDGSYRLLMSRQRDRSDPVSLDGQVVDGVLYVFVLPETDVHEVGFYIDGVFERIEATAPYDLKGTPDGQPRPFFTIDLADGSHSIRAEVVLSSGDVEIVDATFEVANVALPDQVHLAWAGDTATTLTVLWRTFDASTPPSVQVRPEALPGEEASPWSLAMGERRPSGTTGDLNEVTLAGLQPATTYEYRVAADGGGWSAIFDTRTAPGIGAADFDAVYVADTGMIGRADGLATGTEQVVHEIAALDPLLILLGGDYAYFNTDDRFGTLEDTIDAWFNQMRAIATRSPMMVSYGNHEILLGEGYEPWAARFPTPQGFDGRRNYSFDVGDVHFTSILAVENNRGLPGATVDWIDADLRAAKAAGQRWLVPFFHVAPFADGQNHPSNLNTREQLGPVFEELGVAIVLTSHDQAYERTYPLTDVPGSNRPMDLSLRCYAVADGVTWVKVSPGGKLSNLNKSFSEFRTEPPPGWTAVRDNTLHHFARLRASAEGSLGLETYGVKGDGSPPVLQDFFEYRVDGCDPELRFDEERLSFSVAAGDVAQQTVELTTNDGSSGEYVVSSNAAWLSAEPGNGLAPATLSVVADADLLPGHYDGIVSVAAEGFYDASLPVSLTVTGGDSTVSLVVSSSPDRTEATLLRDAVLVGDAFVFVEPADLVQRVEFFLDGTSNQVEGKPPFDFEGTITASGLAKPFRTTGVADGAHAIAADVELIDGTSERIEAVFSVANGAP